MVVDILVETYVVLVVEDVPEVVAAELIVLADVVDEDPPADDEVANPMPTEIVDGIEIVVEIPITTLAVDEDVVVSAVLLVVEEVKLAEEEVVVDVTLLIADEVEVVDENVEVDIALLEVTVVKPASEDVDTIDGLLVVEELEPVDAEVVVGTTLLVVVVVEPADEDDALVLLGPEFELVVVVGVVGLLLVDEAPGAADELELWELDAAL